MPKSNPAQVVTPDSRRWPNLYSELEQAAELVHSQGWTLLLKDLQGSRGRLDNLKRMTLYSIPKDEAAEKIQCFYRGKIAAYEDVINLAKDLKEWKERKP